MPHPSLTTRSGQWSGHGRLDQQESCAGRYPCAGRYQWLESLDLVETGVIDPAASCPRLIQLSDTIAAADCFITRCGIDASPSHLGAQYDHMFSEPGVLVGEEQRLAYRAEILIWIDGKIAPLQRPDLLARVVRSSKMKA
jgi:hypothetical protein